MRRVGHLLLVSLLLGCCFGERLAMYWSTTIEDDSERQVQDVVLLALKYRQDIERRVNDLQLCDAPQPAEDPDAETLPFVTFGAEKGSFTLTALDPLYSFMSIQL